MYLASKFEEIVPPEISEFVYITDDTYTKSQIVRMERMILKVLDFNLAAPTAHNFLLRYLKASEADALNSGKVGQEVSGSSQEGGSDGTQLVQTIQHLSMVGEFSFNICFFFTLSLSLFIYFFYFAPQYLCELALQDADPYLKYYPSVIAASAVCLARHTLGQNAWVRLNQSKHVETCILNYWCGLACSPAFCSITPATACQT